MDNIPRIRTVEPPRGDSKNLMKDPKCEPEQFNDMIIFMSMYNDITSGEKKRNT